MEAHEHEPAAHGIKTVSRLSRLPRAPGTSLHSGHILKTSQIPRATKFQSKTEYPVQAEGGNVHNAIEADYSQLSHTEGQAQTLADNASASVNSLNAESAANSKHDDKHSAHNHQVNSTTTPDDMLPRAPEAPTGEVRKNKPRPSLSERTIETISHIPPSPSPSRRKSSITGTMGSMPPPLLPLSPTGRRSPLGQRLQSSGTRPPGKLIPPTPVLRPNAQNTAHTTPSRGKSQSNQKIPSSAGRLEPESRIFSPSIASTPSTTLAAHRVKSLRDLRASATKQLSRKASLNFKDITPATIDDFKAAPTPQVSSIATKPRVSNVSTPSKLRKRPSLLNNRVVESDSARGNAPTTRSSASLRETIAKAKAAKGQVSTGLNSSDDSAPAFQDEGISAGALKRRIANAITTGTLNVAALGLREVPKDILHMYEYSESSNRNWSEAVDLTKFLIAGNDLEEIPENIFPDWSIEELQEDEGKTNIFGGLETLDLRGNCLSRLPIGVRRLGRLNTLNLSNNRLDCDAIKTICQISSLRELSLANNNLIGPLPSGIEQLARLHTLDLHDNKLTSIDITFSSLNALRKLDLSGNKLASLPVTELEILGITDLDASRNHISNFALSTNCTMLAVLQNLNLAFNDLKKLWKNEASVPQLQSMIMDSNQLSMLPNLAGSPNLITLTASQNKLDDLPDGFVELQSLRTANLSSNNIRVLDPYISRMENLSVLNLASNPLRDRKYLSMSTPEVKAELAKRLTAVLVRDDNNTTPTADQDVNDTTGVGRFKIEKGALDLSGRDLTVVEHAGNQITDTVNSINLSKNKLQSVPTSFLNQENIRNNLKTLTLAHNTNFDPTAYISDAISLPNLRILSLANTGITSLDALITYISAPQLTDLNLSNNHLTGPLPAFQNTFPSLTTLLISDNEFTSITPNAIQGLEVVDIRNNDIEFLPPKIGELGNVGDEKKPGRLRTFECSGNKFRVPRLVVLEKGTEAVLRDLRRMVITDELGEEWRE